MGKPRKWNQLRKKHVVRHIPGTETTQFPLSNESCDELRNGKFDETPKSISMDKVLRKFERIFWTATLISASLNTLSQMQ